MARCVFFWLLAVILMSHHELQATSLFDIMLAGMKNDAPGRTAVQPNSTDIETTTNKTEISTEVMHWVTPAGPAPHRHRRSVPRGDFPIRRSFDFTNLQRDPCEPRRLCPRDRSRPPTKRPPPQPKRPKPPHKPRQAGSRPPTKRPPPQPKRPKPPHKPRQAGSRPPTKRPPPQPKRPKPPHKPRQGGRPLNKTPHPMRPTTRPRPKPRRDRPITKRPLRPHHQYHRFGGPGPVPYGEGDSNPIYYRRFPPSLDHYRQHPYNPPFGQKPKPSSAYRQRPPHQPPFRPKPKPKPKPAGNAGGSIDRDHFLRRGPKPPPKPKPKPTPTPPRPIPQKPGRYNGDAPSIRCDPTCNDATCSYRCGYANRG